MNACPDCSARGAHFRCASCGMHTLLDSKPCFHCRFFRFEAVEADGAKWSPEKQPATIEAALDSARAMAESPPVAAQKTKRRPRATLSS